jgi:hypothetical protein
MVMAVSAKVNAVFSHFQNLNLLVLLQDLRAGRTARQAWLSGSLLCPIAHGLPQGTQVRNLLALGQAADLSEGCCLAARHLGADPGDVLHFVRSWDEGTLSSGSLLRQLEKVWWERLEDAEAMQELLQGEPSHFDEMTKKSPQKKTKNKIPFEESYLRAPSGKLER